MCLWSHCVRWNVHVETVTGHIPMLGAWVQSDIDCHSLQSISPVPSRLFSDFVPDLSPRGKHWAHYSITILPCHTRYHWRPEGRQVKNQEASEVWLLMAQEMAKSIERLLCKHEDLRSTLKPILEKNIQGMVLCACNPSPREVSGGGSLVLHVPPA